MAKRYLVLISRICVCLVAAILLIAFANVCAYVYLRPALPQVDSLRDVQLQVVSEETGEELAVGLVGVLRVKSVRFGPDYFRTNDLASIDDDGFLFLHGRADDAINRGGFKVLPEEVAAVLRRYTGVRDVAVIGVGDARLGQVPIAAVEMLPGMSPPDPRDLDAFARAHLTGYMVPKEYRFVAALPRPASNNLLISNLTVGSLTSAFAGRFRQMI